MTTAHNSQPKWRPSDQEPKNPELYSEQRDWDELQYRSWGCPNNDLVDMAAKAAYTAWVSEDLQQGDWPGYLHADDFRP